MTRNQFIESIKNSLQLRDELEAGKKPTGVYGDSCGGKTFKDDESAILEAQAAVAWSEPRPNCTTCHRWPLMMTTPHAATLLNVSLRRVQAMIAAGRLPATRIGRDWHVKQADVDALAWRKAGRPRKVAP